MKNKFLILSMLFGFSSFAQNVLINGDFSNGLNSWTSFSANWLGINPTYSADNNEANITNITNAGGATWYVQLNQEFTGAQISSLQVGTAYKVSFDARTDAGTRPLRMFFGENGGGFVPVNITDVNINSVMTNYEVTFTVNQTFGAMKLGFEMGLSNSPVWIDNVVLEPFVGPVPPNQPAGLVAFNTVGGNPVGAGEAFLACGPNNVGGGVVYRLFYSPTASAPVDPTTAAEYNFGLTAGDGNGIAAFGFIISGLNPGTEYTFWLYQYNISDNLFSASPAIATVVTGGGGPAGPPPAPAGFVAFDNIGGNPVAAGQAFLACGPNNVGGIGNLVYRLFYSPTASAPVDPTTAAEYTFGATPGDGGGINAFGFVISGLTPCTDYTFWLYQYNTVEELFSLNASIATVISGCGAPAGPPNQPGGFVAFDNVGGNPVNNDQVFLACGPNNVGGTIIYRMYYSPTASAPVDPTTATEYDFGATAGDGGGFSAFGFVLSGLNQGTEYTLWLYQYDLNSGLFSSPNIITYTTGGTAIVINEITQLNALSCGATNVDMNTTLRALNVNMPQYRFRIVGPNNGGAGWDADTYILDRNSRDMKFAFVPGSLWGATYTIDVAVGDGNGNFGAYGDACSVSLIATIPTTQLVAENCNSTNVNPNVNLLAVAVTSATGYRYQVNGPGVQANATITKTMGGGAMRKLKMSEVAGIMAGETYTVEVAIRDAAGNWGAYGSMCSVTLMNAPDMVINNNIEMIQIRNFDAPVFDVQASQNPFTTSFKMQVLNANDVDVINVNIFDMSGKLIERHAVNPMDIEMTTFGSSLNSGMYMFEVKQGSNQVVIRQVKN